MPKVRVNDIELYYEDHGRGDPVLLLTGLRGVGAAWGPQIPLFAKEYRVLVPDHRGCGETSKPEGGYTIEQLASDMAGLLRHLGTGPAHIVGSSTGGAIGQVMAIDHPEVVRSLSLASTWGRTDSFFRRSFEVQKKILLGLGPDAYVEHSSTHLYSPQFFREKWEALLEAERAVRSRPTDIGILIRRIDMILRHDQLARLGKIRKPTLVIVGELDFTTPPYFSRELAERIPGAELAILEGGSHFLYLEMPEVFHRRVRAFMEKH